jgi:hypothetical protein
MSNFERFQNIFHHRKFVFETLKTITFLQFFRFVSVVFVLFRFNRNTEKRCFDIEPKQPKQTSCFG